MKSLVILSGGMDSATALVHVRNNANEVKALAVNYSQRHRRELDCAIALCEELDIPLELLDLSSLGIMLTGNSQTDPEVTVPQGSYTDTNMRTTVVPNRNMILIACAAAIAINEGCEQIVYGAHSGDHAIYPDCRKEFVEAMKKALALCHYEESAPKLSSPFQGMTKGEVVARGMELAVPYHLTHTCYEGTEIACGLCGSCSERLEAFDDCNVIDPIKYAVDYQWNSDCVPFRYGSKVFDGREDS